MDPKGARELEAAGVIDSKFGTVTLLRHPGDAGARSCLGFIKHIDEPSLQISGWSCQGDTLPARRAAIGCMLNRLILLTAGNDPKLAELFARAELRRGSCAAPRPSAASADWVTSAENPPSARRALIGAPAKPLVFKQLFLPCSIILMQCGPFDLVAAIRPAAKVTAKLEMAARPPVRT